MKKISEMTLEELQDYALSIEQENTTLKADKEQLTNDKTELSALNMDLQKRNRKLFLQLEQGNVEDQGTGNGEGATPPPKVESCEDFARNLINKKNGGN